MHDELTAVDIKKMEQEVEYRRLQLRPQLLEDVKTAREFGDLSENFEYKAAKREKSRNDSRIRYLERMIKTAKVIDASSNPDEIGLFDKVTIYIEEDDEEQTIELVTTLRQNALKGLISKESPVGKAVMGHKKGDRVTVHVSETYSYDIVIRDVQKGSDDESLPISSYEDAAKMRPACLTAGRFSALIALIKGSSRRVCPRCLRQYGSLPAGD